VATGLKRDAVTYLRDAVRLDPNNPEALTRLAEVLASLGQNDEAIAMLRVLTIAPNYAAARQALVKLQRQL
jgi:Flp pilus assembly protein TadD